MSTVAYPALFELERVLAIISEEGGALAKSPIPLISFEGLPGAGKTTQVQLVSRYVTKHMGKQTCYIDLPTSSPIGRILKCLYSDRVAWEQIAKESPWFNPVMISADLRLALYAAVRNHAEMAFMSRGILSTIYYNIGAYGHDERDAFYSLLTHIRAFYKPTMVFYLDLPPEIAHARVVARAREPLRKMDGVEEMKKDNKRLLSYLDRLDVPVCHVDAQGEREIVTRCIVDKLAELL